MPDRSPFDERQIDLRLETILTRFPGRYSDAQIAAIRERIATTVDDTRALHAVPLTNGDDPAGPFVPYRADDR